MWDWIQIWHNKNIYVEFKFHIHVEFKFHIYVEFKFHIYMYNLNSILVQVKFHICSIQIVHICNFTYVQFELYTCGIWVEHIYTEYKFNIYVKFKFHTCRFEIYMCWIRISLMHYSKHVEFNNHILCRTGISHMYNLNATYMMN